MTLETASDPALSTHLEARSPGPEASGQILHTICPLDCPDCCSLAVRVDEGRIVSIEGSSRNPLTRGVICNKVRGYARHVYSPERLRTPLRRTGPRGSDAFEPIGWDQAYDLLEARIRQALREDGPESILPIRYGGSNGLLTDGGLDERFFFRLGASRTLRSVCAAATGAAHRGLYGRMPGVALDDYEHARLIVLWGTNPSGSGIHLVPAVLAAQKAGARLVVIDPRCIPLAGRAELHLAVRPGTDLVVALSIIRWLEDAGQLDRAFLDAHTTGVARLLERARPWTFARAGACSGLDPAALEAFARLYAESSPAVIRCGWGLERNRNGGSACAAILALPALAGKFGVRGGGFTMSNSGAIRFDREQVLQAAAPPTLELNLSQLGRLLAPDARPRISLAFVYNSNPLMTFPDQNRIRAGLLRDDLFTVVFDQVMTDTARLADLVLPATTFLEHTELRQGYGAYGLWVARPVVPPEGEARSNMEVFGTLLERLGLSQEGDRIGEEAWIEALVRSSTLPELQQDEVLQTGHAFPAVGRNPVQFVDVLPGTPDGKIQLVPESLEREAPHGLYHFQADPATQEYPLALISPATTHTISSTLGELHAQTVPLQLHPDDGAARGLTTGDRVRVFNALGEVRVDVVLDPAVREGVAVLPKGLWARHTHNGATSTALVDDHLTDIGGGACYNDARVQVEKVREVR